MTAKRTSGDQADPAEAVEVEPGPDLELDEAPPPAEAADDAPEEALVADGTEGAADLDAAEDAVPDDEDDPALAAAAAPDDAAPDDMAPEADDDMAPEAGDDVAPEAGDDAPGDAPGAGEPIRLHRRARHDETEELLTWLRAAPAGAPLTLDASEVDNVSTPYVLAIVAAARARADAGSPAVVTSPSPAFVDAFSDLGLFGDLMKMEIRA